MNISDKIREVIAKHQELIETYQGRINKLHASIAKDRGGIEEYQFFITQEERTVKTLNTFLTLGDEYLNNFFEDLTEED